MMKKSLCCALLLTASLSPHLLPQKTEQQIADIVNSHHHPVDAGSRLFRVWPLPLSARGKPYYFTWG